VGTSGRNFSWFHPRKLTGTAHIELRVPNEARDSVISALQQNQIDASPQRAENVTFNITAAGLDKN
jgi:hypothetical protein